MTEEENRQATEAAGATGASETQVSPAAPEKGKSRRTKVARGARSAGIKAPAQPAVARGKRHSEEEKLKKVGRIDAQVATGVTLKDAVKAEGISDQTYYQWKKAATPSIEVMENVPALADDEFEEFTQLEEENRRLRKLLSEKLRAENAELRRRLGMS